MAIPDTRARMGSGDAMQELIVMMLSVAVVALCVFCITAFARAAYHKKKHLEDHAKAQEAENRRARKPMTRQFFPVI
jgi:hypothetical protein